MENYKATGTLTNNINPQLFDVFLLACEQLIEVQQVCTWKEVFDAFRVSDRESFDDLIKTQNSTQGMTEAFCIVAEITQEDFVARLDRLLSA